MASMADDTRNEDTDLDSGDHVDKVDRIRELELQREEDAYFAQVAEEDAMRMRMQVRAEPGPFLRKLRGNGSSIHCLGTFTTENDHRMVISGHQDGSVCIWDIRTGECNVMIAHAVTVMALSVLSTTTNILAVTGAIDSTCIVWDILKQEKMHCLSIHMGEIRAIHCAIMPTWQIGAELQSLTGFDKSDRAVAFTSELRGRVVEWDLQTFEIIRDVCVDTNRGFVTGIETFRSNDTSQDALVILSTSDNKIMTWNYRTGTLMSTILAHHWPCLCMSLFRPENGSLPLSVSGGCDKIVIISDIDSLQVVRKIEGHTNFITAVHVVHPITTDAPYIVSVCMDGVILLTDIYSGKIMRKFLGPKSFQMTGLAVSQRRGFCGEILLVGGDDGVLHVYNLGANNCEICIQRAHKLEIVTMSIYSVRDHPEWNVIATAGYDNTITLWSTSQRRIGELRGHCKAVASLVFITPGTDAQPTLVSASCDGAVKFWNPFTCKLLKTLEASEGAELTKLSTLVFDNIQYFAACGWNTAEIFIWDGTSGSRRNIRIERRKPGSNAQFTVQCVELYVYRVEHTEEGILRLLACDLLGNIFDYDVNSGKLVRNICGLHSLLVGCTVIRRSPTDKLFLATGGGDHSVAVSNLISGELVYRRSEFTAAISSLEIHCVAIGDFEGLVLFVGCADSTVKLFSFETGNILQVLDGHTSKVINASRLFVSETEWNVVTCCQNGKLTLWDMTYDRRKTMPPRGALALLLFVDIEDSSSKQFRRLTELFEQHGEELFLDCTMLFLQAIFNRKVDFIRKFRDQFTRCVKRLRRYLNGDDMLKFIMGSQDVFSMKLLLSSWIQCLNEAPQNSADQRCLHLSHFIEKSSILQLAEQYPSDFANFVQSIKLVPADTVVNKSFSSYNLQNRSLEISCIEVHQINGYFDNQLDSSRADNGQPISTLYLPFLDACDMEFLQMYVTVTRDLNTMDIFNCDVVTVALTHIWRKTGRRNHIKAFKIYFLFAILQALSVYSFNFFLEHSRASQVIAWIIQGCGLIFSAYYIRSEVMQINSMSNLPKYFANVWNWMDLVAYITNFAAIIIRIANYNDVESSQGLLAISSISTWFKILYFLRAFSSSGPLVSMILQIAYDIRFFLLVLFFVLAGFAQAFFILSVNAESFPFSTIRGSFLTSFVYMLGNFDTDFSGTALPHLGTFLVVLFLLIMTILMLNLLIALMGQSFSTVAENGLGQWRYELASILIDQEDLLGVSIPPCIFVLKYTSDLKGDQSSEISGTFSHDISVKPAVKNNEKSSRADDEENNMLVSVNVLRELREEMQLLDAKREALYQERLSRIERKLDRLMALVAEDD